MTELELWKLAVPELDDDGLLNKICLDIATDMDQHNKIIDGILQKIVYLNIHLYLELV